MCVLISITSLLLLLLLLLLGRKGLFMQQQWQQQFMRASVQKKNFPTLPYPSLNDSCRLFPLVAAAAAACDFFIFLFFPFCLCVCVRACARTASLKFFVFLDPLPTSLSLSPFPKLFNVPLVYVLLCPVLLALSSSSALLSPRLSSAVAAGSH